MRKVYDALPPFLGLALSAALAAGCATASLDALLLEDRGGLTPTHAQIEAAAALGDPARREAALATLERLSPRERVDVLRAGLRLCDPAAARECAARLGWKQIDRWECARCVDLLVDEILRPDRPGDFEEFRSYIGSVELPRYLRSLPPPPWDVIPDQAIGQMHRVARANHIPDYIALLRHPDTDVADAAASDLGLLGLWNDDFREEVEAAFLAYEDGPTAIPAAAPGVAGLPPVLAAALRRNHLERQSGMRDGELPHWDLRWLWDCTPGPQDADLLMALTNRGDASWDLVTGVAFVLLGRLSDPVTEAFLRTRAEDGEELAEWALARRGDREMLKDVLTDALDGDRFALALLMERVPSGARQLLEKALLGPDDAAAHEVLEALAEFATPGAFFEPLGFDWRRTTLAGLDRAAVEARIPAIRLARIGVTVPGCRTGTVAAEAARALAPGDLVEDDERGIGLRELEAIGAFLETAAPEELSEALRRIRAAGGDDAPRATGWLMKMADPETCAAVATAPDPDPEFFLDLARSGAAEVRRMFESRVRAGLASGKFEYADYRAARGLALLHGLPESAAETLFFGGDEIDPRAPMQAVLDGRPVEGLATFLAEHPDEEHGYVGEVDDPRVRAYLARLRERRDLGLYWYATGQLAVAGDPDACADFWGAMQDGRYRIMDSAEEFERTLGFDLPATMPFWIEELRSQCCRMVTSGAGNLVEDTLGLQHLYHSPHRTAWRRAKELWNAAEGRFVRSRIAGHWVPEPR